MSCCLTSANSDFKVLTSLINSELSSINDFINSSLPLDLDSSFLNRVDANVLLLCTAGEEPLIIDLLGTGGFLVEIVVGVKPALVAVFDSLAGSALLVDEGGVLEIEQ